MQPAASASDILDATLLFLARHEEALDAGVPARALEACESLHSGLCTTLAAQVGQAHNARPRAAAPEPKDAAAFVAGLEGARDAEAWAFASLRKRMAEAEGALLHLRLTLAKGSADGPALLAYHKRVYGETLAVRKALAGVRVALAQWEAAARGDASRAAKADARALTRAAREALLAGCPQAAGPLLRAALDDAMAQPSPLDAASLRRVRARLDAPVEDPVLAWRLLDFVEYAVNVAGLPPS